MQNLTNENSLSTISSDDLSVYITTGEAVGGEPKTIYKPRRGDHTASGYVRAVSGDSFAFVLEDSRETRKPKGGQKGECIEIWFGDKKVVEKTTPHSHMPWDLELGDERRLSYFSRVELDQNHARPFKFAKPQSTTDSHVATWSPEFIENYGSARVIRKTVKKVKKAGDGIESEDPINGVHGRRLDQTTSADKAQYVMRPSLDSKVAASLVQSGIVTRYTSGVPAEGGDDTYTFHFRSNPYISRMRDGAALPVTSAFPSASNSPRRRSRSPPASSSHGANGASGALDALAGHGGSGGNIFGGEPDTPPTQRRRLDGPSNTPFLPGGVA
ncbi:hypothetical protein JCM10213_007686 [Rhodosporidiobolus nylandii]